MLELEIQIHRPNVLDITWTRAKTWREYNPKTRKRDLVKHFPEDVDAWAEYFRRLHVLVDFNFIRFSKYFEEAAGFISRSDSISDGVAAELSNSSLKYRDRIVFDLASRKLFVKAIVPALDRHNMYAKDEDLSRALALLRKSISHFPED